MAEVASSDGESAQVQAFLAGVLEHMRIEARVKLDEKEDRLLLEIECTNEDDVQRIIGRRGQVVDALQHLAAKMLVKVRGERGKILVVDAGGYRQKHIERLEELAERMAEKCKTSGAPVELSPMPAHDRRIVHMKIAVVGGVTTRSEGEGDLRHIVVVPG